MKKLEYFLPRTLPWCLSVPEPLVYQALIDCAIQFCEETHIVRFISDPIMVVANVQDYDIDLPQFTDLARILRVWYGPDPYGIPSGFPTNWFVTDTTTLTIIPVPTTQRNDWMFMEIATKPTRTATTVDDLLYTDYIEGIAGGAVARICQMPDQPWSNDDNAAKGQALYQRWKGKAQIEGTKGRVRRDTTVKMRPFA